MARSRNDGRGDELANQLIDALRQLDQVPADGARNLPTVEGVGPKTLFVAPQENVLANIGDILAQSGRVYRRGSDILMEIPATTDRQASLAALREGGKVTTSAQAILSNLFICIAGDLQFPPTKRLVDTLLFSETVVNKLPAIQEYSTLPTFDMDFCLRGPGWHPDAGILVHGPVIEPEEFRPQNGDGPLERLPQRLRELVAGFCFREAADLCNFIGTLLTGVLARHFVESGKPSIIHAGNQPGVGKSLLARVLGILLNGFEPHLIAYTPDEDELQKRIGACLNNGNPAVLVVDNAKVKGGATLSSAVLEANITAPIVRLRILGQSANIEAPNTLLWVLTMNNCAASPDLVSRSLPVRLSFDGNPARRKFATDDPIEYARQHRLEILGELFGMIDYWNQRGRAEGTMPNRFGHWSRIIGGIQQVCGFAEFLANVDDAAAEFDPGLNDLAKLAEHVVRCNVTEGFSLIQDGRQGDDAAAGLTASEWIPIFIKAAVLSEDLATARTEHSKSTKAGAFLGRSLDREVPIEVKGRSCKALLKDRKERSRRRVYYFEIHPVPVGDGTVEEFPPQIDDGLD